MNNIKDILESHEVQPSAECWQKISQHLDQVMPTSTEGGSGHGLSAQEAGKHVARLAGAAKAKLIVAIAGLVLGGGAITMVSLSKRQSPSDPVVPASSTVSDSLHNDCQPLPNLSETSDVTDSYPKNQTEYIKELNTTEFVTKEVLSQPEPEVFPTTPEAPTPLPPAPQAPVAAPIPSTLPTPVLHITTPQEDPVAVEHLEDIENLSTPMKIEIPNVFTPNGDGINDLFVILGIEQCHKRQLTVRDRSGKVVFHSDQYDNNWGGDNCHDGVYYYQFTFSGNQIEETLKGSVTIIRK